MNGIRQTQTAHPTLKNRDLRTSSSFCKVIFPRQPDGWLEADESHSEGRKEKAGEKRKADLVKYLLYFTSVFLTPHENGLFSVQRL